MSAGYRGLRCAPLNLHFLDTKVLSGSMVIGGSYFQSCLSTIAFSIAVVAVLEAVSGGIFGHDRSKFQHLHVQPVYML